MPLNKETEPKSFHKMNIKYSPTTITLLTCYKKDKIQRWPFLQSYVTLCVCVCVWVSIKALRFTLVDRHQLEFLLEKKVHSDVQSV